MQTICVQPLVIGVTSHRNLVPRESAEIRSSVRAFLERLGRELPHLPLTVVSALAASGSRTDCSRGEVDGDPASPRSAKSCAHSARPRSPNMPNGP